MSDLTVNQARDALNPHSIRRPNVDIGELRENYICPTLGILTGGAYLAAIYYVLDRVGWWQLPSGRLTFTAEWFSWSSIVVGMGGWIGSSELFSRGQLAPYRARVALRKRLTAELKPSRTPLSYKKMAKLVRLGGEKELKRLGARLSTRQKINLYLHVGNFFTMPRATKLMIERAQTLGTLDNFNFEENTRDEDLLATLRRNVHFRQNVMDKLSSERKQRLMLKILDIDKAPDGLPVSLEEFATHDEKTLIALLPELEKEQNLKPFTEFVCEIAERKAKAKGLFAIEELLSSDAVKTRLAENFDELKALDTLLDRQAALLKEQPDEGLTNAQEGNFWARKREQIRELDTQIRELKNTLGALNFGQDVIDEHYLLATKVKWPALEKICVDRFKGQMTKAQAADVLIQQIDYARELGIDEAVKHGEDRLSDNGGLWRDGAVPIWTYANRHRMFDLQKIAIIYIRNNRNRFPQDGSLPFALQQALKR